MDDDVPPLLPPDRMPPVRSQADLHRLWRSLMGPLGFARSALWTVLLDADGRVLPAVQEMTDRPERPDPNLLTMLLDLQATLLTEHAGTGGRVAFLLVRPGAGWLRDEDRAWASGLLTAAHAVGVPCEPVHLATDERVRVLAPDDLTPVSRAG